MIRSNLKTGGAINPQTVDTHNITTSQTYAFTLNADKDYILAAYSSTGAGCSVNYITNGTNTSLVAQGSMGSIQNVTSTSAEVYGYAIGNATITWTLIQLN